MFGGAPPGAGDLFHTFPYGGQMHTKRIPSVRGALGETD